MPDFDMEVPTQVTSRMAAQLIIHEPFWAEMYYSMFVYELPDGFMAPRVDTLATDGGSLWVNHKYWKWLGEQVKAGVSDYGRQLQRSAIGHEIVHKMLNHCTRRGDRDPLLWNGAADESDNELLADNGFQLHPQWVQPVAERRGWSVERRYAAMQQKAQEEQQASNGTKNGPGDCDCVPQSWKDAWQDIKEPDGKGPEEIAKAEAATERAIRKALATAKAAGKVPKGIEQAMAFAFAPAEEPWYNHLHRFMQQLCRSEYHWQRFNKRNLVVHGLFSPDFYSEALGPIVIFRDTSGSCYAYQSQKQIMSHVQAIMAEAKPEQLILVDFDASIHHNAVFDRGDEHIDLTPKGGGGTSFTPLFDWVTEQGINPAVVLVITDMYGTFPQRHPDYNVIWVSISEVDTAPFGEVINVK